MNAPKRITLWRVGTNPFRASGPRLGRLRYTPHAMRHLSEWLRRALAVAGLVELAVAAGVLMWGGWQWHTGLLSISATHPLRPAIAGTALLGLYGLSRPGGGAAWVVPPVAALVILLVAQSPPRRVGDGAEYVAMAVNLAEARPARLTPEEIRRASAVFGDDQGFVLTMPAYRGSDGLQDFPHFWLYSLLAAPFVRAAFILHVTPLAGFTALNLLLLAAALAVILWRAGPAASVLLVAGPIVWWVDKAHTEVFTFTVVAGAIGLLPSAPWWSLALLGIGAAQNPPLILAFGVTLASALGARGARDRRVWWGAAAGAAAAALHPLYYGVRLGRPSGLLIGFDGHVPSAREIVTVLLDPNVGVLVLDPALALAIVTLLVLVLRREPKRLAGFDHLAAAGIGVALLVAFTQTWNFNSGGTPGPSRYGLWILPLALPLLADVPSGDARIRALAAVSLVWCTVMFAPRLPDRYLTPTALAARLWTSWPGLDNPLAEVFAERVTGRDPSPAPPLATAGCEKVLLLSHGGQPAWPPSCQAVPAPQACLSPGALCYANRRGQGYAFVPAPSGPAWRRTYERTLVSGEGRSPTAGRP